MLHRTTEIERTTKWGKATTKKEKAFSNEAINKTMFWKTWVKGTFDRGGKHSSPTWVLIS